MNRLDRRIATAVRRFWGTRTRQRRTQGSATGKRDYGNRTAATGGKQLDGFNELLVRLLVEAGIPSDAVFCGRRTDVTLPGFFRPSKQWDVVVVAKGAFLASIECKALCGPSFGNNYNNRVEEALGSATDIWTAYREGAFERSPRPFLGYFMLLEEAQSSTRPVDVCERHFPVFRPFLGASYATRCEETLRRLVRERCYDAGCLLLTGRGEGLRGKYRQPASDLTFERLVRLLCNHTMATYRAL